MEAQDLMDKITNGADINVIDVRDTASFQQEHIVDSQNIPLADFSDAVSTLDKNKTYVLFDQSEDPTLVALVQNILAKNGYDKIYYLSGGFSNWKTLDLPAVADGDPQSFTDQSKVNYIKSDDLKKTIDSGENLYIIDLRTSNEYSGGHIKNAVNIYLGDLEKRRGEIPLGKKVILVDNDGLWAFKGAVRLFDTGTFNVFALSDGLNAWQQKGYEMVK
jgi:rhodanese-related sulfurtransferase